MFLLLQGSIFGFHVMFLGCNICVFLPISHSTMPLCSLQKLSHPLNIIFLLIRPPMFFFGGGTHEQICVMARSSIPRIILWHFKFCLSLFHVTTAAGSMFPTTVPFRTKIVLWEESSWISTWNTIIMIYCIRYPRCFSFNQQVGGE